MLNPNFLIRKMTLQDIDEVMQIENDSFTLPWSKESYLSELENNFTSYYVCDFEGEVAGYGGIWLIFEEAHITNVAVRQEFRGRGMGEAIMKELEKAARQKKTECILLEVRPSNDVALNMYKKMGFKSTGVRREYYSDNQEDAIIMIKNLS